MMLNKETIIFIHGQWRMLPYLKLSNVTLGYTFPKNLIARVGLKNLRLYATGNNLLTWTKYSGFDPEVSTMKKRFDTGC